MRERSSKRENFLQRVSDGVECLCDDALGRRRGAGKTMMMMEEWLAGAIGLRGGFGMRFHIPGEQGGGGLDGETVMRNDVALARVDDNVA